MTPSGVRVVAFVACLAWGCGAQEPYAETRPVKALALEASLRAALADPTAAPSLDLIMYGEDYFGAEPQDVRVTDDGKRALFSWKRPLEQRGTWELDLATRALRRLPDDERPPTFGLLDPARTRRLVVEGTTLHLETFDPPVRTLLARLPGGVVPRAFTSEGKAALVVSGDALLRIPFDGPGVETLLEWGPPRKADEPAAASRPAKKDLPRGERLAAQMRDQQLALFRVLFERDEKRRTATRPAPDLRGRPARFDVPKGWRVERVVPSPHAGRAVCVVERPPEGTARVEKMPDYVTESGYTETRDTREKSGEPVAERACHLIRFDTGAVIPVTLPDGVRPVEVAWSNGGGRLLLRGATRDRESMTLFLVDADDGRATPVFERKDPAWVLWDEADGAWLGMSDSYAFISESGGFRNLHVLDAALGTTRVLAAGRYEVHDPWFSPDGTWALASASVRGPAERDLVRIDIVRGTVETLTSGGGWYTHAPSPRGDVVLTVASSTTRPHELEIRGDAGRAAPIRVTDSPSSAFKSVAWPEPAFVDVASEGETRVPARLYRPRDGTRGGPGVVFVHGAGYLQNVHRGWSRYSREYGFHQLLAEAGYTVLDIDYRGSAGYGRDFRAAHKNRIGEADTLDAVAAARHLVAVEGCDAGRIGIYGGSYGGFLTLMALFRHPGVFAAGAALRPVTDWHHYNEGYTANLLDDPIDHEDAWRKASPIWWADGLSDRLLICHGLVDDNVLAQDSIRLVQRLIELRKTTFEVMLYPLENHGFRDPAAWSDEYRRIRALFDAMPARR